MPSDSPTGPFHVHPQHAFDGFTIENRLGVLILIARCDCGAALDVADAIFKDCPDCAGDDAMPACGRCGGTGAAVDHNALIWRRP